MLVLFDDQYNFICATKPKCRAWYIGLHLLHPASAKYVRKFVQITSISQDFNAIHILVGIYFSKMFSQFSDRSLSGTVTVSHSCIRTVDSTGLATLPITCFTPFHLDKDLPTLPPTTPLQHPRAGDGRHALEQRGIDNTRKVERVKARQAPPPPRAQSLGEDQEQQRRIDAQDGKLVRQLADPQGRKVAPSRITAGLSRFQCWSQGHSHAKFLTPTGTTCFFMLCTPRPMFRDLSARSKTRFEAYGTVCVQTLQ